MRKSPTYSCEFVGDFHLSQFGVAEIYQLAFLFVFGIDSLDFFFDQY